MSAVLGQRSTHAARTGATWQRQWCCTAVRRMLVGTDCQRPGDDRADTNLVAIVRAAFAGQQGRSMPVRRHPEIDHALLNLTTGTQRLVVSHPRGKRIAVRGQLFHIRTLGEGARTMRHTWTDTPAGITLDRVGHQIIHPTPLLTDINFSADGETSDLTTDDDVRAFRSQMPLGAADLYAPETVAAPWDAGTPVGILVEARPGTQSV